MEEGTISLDAELLEDISTYLEDEISLGDDKLLKLLIKLAIKNVRKYRNYPDTYTEEMISGDMQKHYGIIFSAVRNAWNKQGVEGEKSHSENGMSASFIDEPEWYSGVIPIARLL